MCKDLPKNIDCLCLYKSAIDSKIKSIVYADRKSYQHKQTLLGNDSQEFIECLKTAHEVRQLLMKEGFIIQVAMGNFYGWIDLGSGHESGLDILKKDNSCIIEIKNSWNTCNSSSRKVSLDKLAQYKSDNPDTKCVFGIVNPRDKCRNLTRKIFHNNQEIWIIQGTDLLKLIFMWREHDYSNYVIKHIKDLMFPPKTTKIKPPKVKIKTHINLKLS